MSECIKMNIAGFDLVLSQDDDTGMFTVDYGAEHKPELDYETAATEFGTSLFHALACEGKLDSSRIEEGYRRANEWTGEMKLPRQST
jgi:hypothetical protein